MLLEALVARIPDPNIEIHGVAHWSVRGELKRKLWYWGIRVNNWEEGRVLTDGPGVHFVKEIEPYLPDNYDLRLIPPDGIPGGTWSFSIPLHKTKDPIKVKKILQRYFHDVS